jgi:hypothetical protein
LCNKIIQEGVRGIENTLLRATNGTVQETVEPRLGQGTNGLASEEDEGMKNMLARKTNKTVQGTVEMRNPVSQEARNLILAKRSKMIVSLRVKNGTHSQEGVIEKCKISEGIYLASSLTRVKGDQVITSIRNTRNEEVTIKRPIIEWENYDREEFQKEGPDEYIGLAALVKESETRRQTGEVLGKLRLDHLNYGERGAIEKLCRDCQDIFHLLGEELSCTSAIKHSIKVVPGTNPVTTKPYRLPEAQKTEIKKQIR